MGVVVGERKVVCVYRINVDRVGMCGIITNREQTIWEQNVNVVVKRELNANNGTVLW